ncbi:MAG: hypothetical protein RLZZ76_137 [Candidatus Parcubacteria bacterium]|jgi:hypothetical protein
MNVFNKSFYKFLWGFVAVVTATLTIVLIVGMGSR